MKNKSKEKGSAMKFGKTLLKLRIPEWSHLYVNYKVLKKILKEITKVQDDLYQQENSANGEGDKPLWKKEEDGMTSDRKTFAENKKIQQLIISFFFNLDRDIEKVDSFYNSQFSEYEKRLQKLLQSSQFQDVTYLIENREGEKELTPVGNGSIPPRYATPHHIDDVNEVYNILSELKTQFRNLKNYSELNKRAFVKILKKFDKITGLSRKDIFLQNRIYPLPFANETQITKDLGTINEIWSKLSSRGGVIGALNPSVDELLQSTENLIPQIKLNDSPSVKGQVTSINDITPFIDEDNGKGIIAQLIQLYGTITAVPTRSLINLSLIHI